MGAQLYGLPCDGCPQSFPITTASEFSAVSKIPTRSPTMSRVEYYCGFIGQMLHLSDTRKRGRLDEMAHCMYITQELG